MQGYTDEAPKVIVGPWRRPGAACCSTSIAWTVTLRCHIGRWLQRRLERCEFVVASLWRRDKQKPTGRALQPFISRGLNNLAPATVRTLFGRTHSEATSQPALIQRSASIDAVHARLGHVLVDLQEPAAGNTRDQHDIR